MSPRKPLKKLAGKAKKGRRKRRKLDSAWKEVSGLMRNCSEEVRRILTCHI